jgi:polyisoprenoid-binding protein YceI
MPDSRSFLRRFRWPLAILGAVVLVAVVAPFVYINFIKPEPAERLSLDDVPTETGDEGEVAAGIEGTWTTTDDSVVQYRVQEVLFGQDAEATGTADGVTGSVEITGTEVTSAEVEVDMTTFESPESGRDGQFQGRIMETAEFPTASFSLTEPIDLGGEPADGEEISVAATGELTMHGVTQTITFDLAARRSGSTFAANATIPITFSDYEIDDPSGGPAQVGDTGELELLLVFGQ